MIRLDAEGLQRTEIARRTGIGVASVYRVLADAKKDAVNRKVASVTGQGRSGSDATGQCVSGPIVTGQLSLLVC